MKLAFRTSPSGWMRDQSLRTRRNVQEKKEREEAGKARLSSFFQSEKGKANESKQSSGSKARNGGLKANEARQWLGFRSMLWRMEAQISRCPLDSVIV